ncbi:PREDICTED: uncharacterized protein LOC104606196 [Nelumbo nucifera]|uniref:FLZ-type domain-containing protein n=2 Tax=Nelumbo nucifera TaxID=4432 RepID=A0A822YGE6_NELNU|nr:PREDICTED: uncharacterized protein LOC104606196 [Nelumbo nucifera]DAD33264.1 TPA_asm: hypothetical protein HUJ06_012115 [Nelumbo nucifera]
MVGLSILLEAQKNLKESPQVINKTTMVKPIPSPSSTSSSLYSSSPLPAISFLDECFLCKQRLLPGHDIYMYRGDRAFCSVECRCSQILMDEENIKREICYQAAMRPTSSSPSSSSSSRHRKGNRSRAGAFAY